MLGVCEALGQDFGFHPNLLRVALGALVLWSPWAALGIYLGLGAIVGLSRLVAPQRLVPASDAPQLNSTVDRVDNETGELSLAA